MSMQWRVTYYVANRFGSMQEKSRHFPGTLTVAEASARFNQHAASLRTAGLAIYPGFDIEAVSNGGNREHA